jgi:hypothetical protein
VQKGLPVGNLADVLNRTTPGEPCGEPTRGSSSCRLSSPESQIALRDGSNGVDRQKYQGQGIAATSLESAGSDDRNNASVVVGERLSREKMVPFKVRIHVVEAI